MEKVLEVLDELREQRRELLAKVAGLDQAIAMIENAMGVAPATTPTGVRENARTPAQSAPSPLPAIPEAEPGPYAMSGIYDAAAKYLSKTPGEPRSARQIAEALLAGGFRTRAENFQASVRTMLHRKASAGEFGIYETEEGSRWVFRA